MKRVTTILITFLLCASSLTYAQRRNHFAIQIAPQYGLDDYSVYNTDFSIMYIRDIGRLFHLGAGAGVGTSKLNSYEFDEKHSYNVTYVPVFLKAQIDFSSKNAYTYGAIKAGARLFGSTPNRKITHQGETITLGGYNPTLASVTPSIGYNVPIGQLYLGIEAGIEFLYGRENTIFIGDDGSTWHHSQKGFYKSIGMAISLQF